MGLSKKRKEFDEKTRKLTSLVCDMAIEDADATIAVLEYCKHFWLTIMADEFKKQFENLVNERIKKNGKTKKRN